MHMSESLQKNVLDVGVGSIINTLKIKKRRDVLFFEEILQITSGYAKTTGIQKRCRILRRNGLNAALSQTIPAPFLKVVSPIFVINDVLCGVWHNLG